MKPWALYNEIDDYAASWLENLIAAGHIANGTVDRRSIEDLRGDDLRGFRQVHLFAGIGVWSYALRRAGVPDDFAIWSGSCPCQPFSSAGKGGGVADERHLWPAFYHLIRECRPQRVVGEQVASKDGLGWLDIVQADMEEADYAFGAVDTCSAGSGAPHIRQRLRFNAYDLRSATGRLAIPKGLGGGTRLRNTRSGGNRRDIDCDSSSASFLADAHGDESWEGRDSRGSHNQGVWTEPGRCSSVGWMDDLLGEGLEGQWSGHRPEIGQWKGPIRPASQTSEFDWMDDLLGDGRDEGRGDHRKDDGILLDATSTVVGMAHADIIHGDGRRSSASHDGGQLAGSSDLQGRYAGVLRPGPTNGFWRDADWLFCRDERWRPIEPGTFPLAHGVASRVGRLRAYGNAVDAEATTDFLVACLEPQWQEIEGFAVETPAVFGPEPVTSNSTECGMFEDLLG